MKFTLTALGGKNGSPTLDQIAKINSTNCGSLLNCAAAEGVTFDAIYSQLKTLTAGGISGEFLAHCQHECHPNCQSKYQSSCQSECNSENENQSEYHNHNHKCNDGCSSPCKIQNHYPCGSSKSPKYPQDPKCCDQYTKWMGNGNDGQIGAPSLRGVPGSGGETATTGKGGEAGSACEPTGGDGSFGSGGGGSLPYVLYTECGNYSGNGGNGYIRLDVMNTELCDVSDIMTITKSQ